MQRAPTTDSIGLMKSIIDNVATSLATENLNPFRKVLFIQKRVYLKECEKINEIQNTTINKVYIEKSLCFGSENTSDLVQGSNDSTLIYSEKFGEKGYFYEFDYFDLTNDDELLKLFMWFTNETNEYILKMNYFVPSSEFITVLRFDVKRNHPSNYNIFVIF